MMEKEPRSGHVKASLVKTTIVLLTLLIPNTALFVGGLAGSYMTYLVWSVLILISIPLIHRSGTGAIDPHKSLIIGFTLIVVLISLGFIWGFDLRVNLVMLTPSHLLLSLAIFLVQVIGIEVGRSAVVGLVRGFWSKMILGTLSGLFFGSTIYVILSHFSGIAKAPITMLPGLFYSTILTTLHIFGGFGAAIAFRLLVDGYMRFSPIITSTSELGIVWSGFLSMIYYGILVVILYSVRRLRGASKDVFVFSFVKKVRKYVPEVISLLLVIFVLMTLHFKIIPLVIVSGSMRPTYDIGDIVLVAVGPAKDVKVGDVVAFIFEGREVIVHRVYQVLPDSFRTKGDAYTKPDPFIVRKKSVVGKVIGYIPKLGWITIVFREGFKSREGIIVTALIASIAVVASSIGLMRRRKLKFKRSGTYW